MLNVISAIFERYDIFLFILVRMLGFIVLNPILGRKNVPAMVRGAVAFVLAIFALMTITSNAELDALQVGSLKLDNMVMFVLLLVKEFAFGYLISLIVNMFFTIVVIAGDIMDMQMGLGMSKMYDPASNIQMPVSGNFYNIALMIMFFVTNSHITLVKIMLDSFYLSPVGVVSFNADVGIYVMRIFGEIFILSLKLAFPVMAAELITETGVGIVMRAVPQINVFVVGLQLKILAGIGVMLLCAPVSVWFFDGMLGKMNDTIYEALKVLTG